jgi:hypothetical protein
MAALLWPSSSKQSLPAGVLASCMPDTAAPLLPQTPPLPEGGAGPAAEGPSRRRRIFFFVCIGLVVAAVLALILVVGSNYRNGSGGSYSGSSLNVRFLAVSACVPALARPILWCSVYVYCSVAEPPPKPLCAHQLPCCHPCRRTMLQVGDWGREGSLNQSEVAALMAQVAAASPPDFIVSTGGWVQG